MLGGLDVGQVLMVGPNDKWLKPIPPLLQCKLNGQQLIIPYIIVAFCLGEALREGGTQVELLVRDGSLGEHSQHPHPSLRHPPL